MATGNFISNFETRTQTTFAWQLTTAVRLVPSASRTTPLPSSGNSSTFAWEMAVSNLDGVIDSAETFVVSICLSVGCRHDVIRPQYLPSLSSCFLFANCDHRNLEVRVYSVHLW